MRRRPIGARLLVVFAAALVLGGAIGGCGKGTVWSTKDEVRIGQELSKEVEHEYRVEHDTADARRVQRIGERLLAHSDERPGVPYSFSVLDTKQVNAVSLPGGPIYVYRGLLDLVGTDTDALACIIGHEMGHINGRHIAHQYTKELELQGLLTVLLGGKSASVQNLAGLAEELLTLKFSRDDEYEADARGLSYAYKAGYDPNGLIRFFQKLEVLEKQGGQEPEFLMTHPLTQARINRARKIIESGDYRFGH